VFKILQVGFPKIFNYSG